MASAFAILAKELLGYNVVFNPIAGGFGTYRRAAWQPETGAEGKFIEERMADGTFGNSEWQMKYVYFNPEIWTQNKQDEKLEMINSKGRAVDLGALGYSGVSGVYVADKFADDPNFLLRFYTAFNDTAERNTRVFDESEATFPSLTEDCMKLESSGKCFDRRGR